MKTLSTIRITGLKTIPGYDATLIFLTSHWDISIANNNLCFLRFTFIKQITNKTPTCWFDSYQ
jgi:hypothetical protein